MPNARRTSARWVRRLAAVTALGGFAALGLASPAAAHVRVDSGEPVSQGGYGVVRLIVPTESDDASTVGVTVTIPDDVNLTSARTQPIPGWTATIESEPSGSGERVSRIAWRATDPASGLKASEFGVFTLSAGPWPQNVDSVPLPSDQTYSDGSVVSWNEVAVDEGAEPEHPAPVVTLVAGGSGHGDGHAEAASASSAGTSQSDDHAEASAPTDDSSAWLWQTIAVVALLLALGSTGAVIALLRRGHGDPS
ncbi:YcnI family protein [Rhodococcus sp. NPDC003318]|uniref:YcnI family copper-binding membrane protein n=1 Tax=Rhodococcus sp. NPDC003318 TaxID=3364503 RepID=UPI003699A098